jgi:predicted short-subunit dehydrogenase-like oxidoreductase (DUF2520 family)
MNEPTYGLIGRGRVARHIAHYLELEGLPFVRWHRAMSLSVQTAIAEADVVLLAISDDALEAFVADHPELWDRSPVHFSGSLVLAGVYGLHPLMTFGTELYDLETYRSIPFIGEHGGIGFGEVFPSLKNPSWTIDPDQKPLYHALCVLAGNCTTLLWSKAFDDFEERLGLPPETLQPFLNRTCGNTSAVGREALTGPFSRGDVETIARDLRALDGDGFADVYRAFTAISGLEEMKS